MTLADIKAGQIAVIKSVSNDSTTRAKLMDLGMIPGTTLTLKRNLPWSKAVQVNVRQANLILRNTLAKQVNVSVVQGSKS